MADGAYLGVDAERALGTILGGKESPAKEEQMDDTTFAVWLRSAPENPASYGETARLAGRYLLEYLERHPERQNDPLDDKHDFDRMRADGVLERSKIDSAVWKNYLLQTGIWDDAKQEFPQLESLDLTGFMVGWAFNAARKVLALSPAPNPALLTIG